MDRDAIIMIIGNKIDRESEREVDKQLAKQYGKQIPIKQAPIILFTCKFQQWEILMLNKHSNHLLEQSQTK